VTAVIISGVSSLLIGLAIGYLIEHCRMKKKMSAQEFNEDLLANDGENEAEFERPTSIN